MAVGAGGPKISGADAIGYVGCITGIGCPGRLNPPTSDCPTSLAVGPDNSPKPDSTLDMKESMESNNPMVNPRRNTAVECTVAGYSRKSRRRVSPGDTRAGPAGKAVEPVGPRGLRSDPPRS